jgi:hypothetical protein
MDAHFAARRAGSRRDTRQRGVGFAILKRADCAASRKAALPFIPRFSKAIPHKFGGMMSSGFFVKHGCRARRFTGGKSMGLQEVNG